MLRTSESLPINVLLIPQASSIRSVAKSRHGREKTRERHAVASVWLSTLWEKYSFQLFLKQLIISPKFPKIIVALFSNASRSIISQSFRQASPHCSKVTSLFPRMRSGGFSRFSYWWELEREREREVFHSKPRRERREGTSKQNTPGFFFSPSPPPPFPL